MGLTWLALGDSITYGTGGTNRFNGYIYRTRSALKTASLDHFLINGGVGGFRSDQILAARRGLGADADPDLITVMCGTNDISQSVDAATFKTHLSDLVDALQASKYAGRGVIVLCSVLWRNDANNDQVATFNTAIQEVAEDKNVLFCDTHEAFSSSDYLSDAVHPNDDGHQAIADILAPFLEELTVWENTAERSVQ